jgi:hypothetical protein
MVVSDDAAPQAAPDALTPEERAYYDGIIGKTFGRLTVVGEAERAADGKRRLWVVCSCAKKTKKAVLLNSLQSGGTASCGCAAARLFRVRGREQSLRAWALETGIAETTLNGRVSRGMTMSGAIDLGPSLRSKKAS